MKGRRLGCLVFGICWTAVFLFTNVGLALGHPADQEAANPLAVAFWVEVAVFVVAAILFYQAEKNNPEL